MFEEQMPHGCHLCKKPAHLSESHIIPKFVFKWLKDTSPTGYLRTGDSINRRTQDGFKARLLCSDCEVSLSKFENKFKNAIFDRSTQKQHLNVTYSDWMPLFCVSVVWRACELLNLRGAFDLIDQNTKKEIDCAVEVWRNYVLGQKNHFSTHPVHIVDVWQFHDANHEDIPGNWNRFLNRHCAINVFTDTRDNSILIFSKMGPVAVFGFVIPPKRKWHGTRVNGSNGVFTSKKIKVPSDLFFQLVAEAKRHQEVVGDTSENQMEVIENSILSHIERFTTSPSFVDLHADVARFGESAFIDKNKP